MNPSLISISGSSGVGKTTISELVAAVLGDEDTLTISGDDLHKWERGSPEWKVFTHLNPEANEIEMGTRDILLLMEGKGISRRRYNHDTGTFDDPVELHPKRHIIHEGLHALWDERLVRSSDIRIYVDTDDSLKKEWKINRDTRKRGYTESQVVEVIERRRKDEESYILPQRSRADCVMAFVRDGDRVQLRSRHLNDRGIGLVRRVESLYEDLMAFVSTCKRMSLDSTLTQGRGGNVSVKSSEGLIVTESGRSLSEVNIHQGYSICSLDFVDGSCGEHEYLMSLRRMRRHGGKMPSMETGFHANLHHKFIVHTHPIHLNAILCSREAGKIIPLLFKDIEHELIDYVAPGNQLVSLLGKNRSPVIFLRNHGLIVGSDEESMAELVTERINDRCKEWLLANSDAFSDTMKGFQATPLPLFPDAAVFPEEMAPVSRYILGLIETANLKPRFLSKTEVDTIAEMAAERYRRNLK